VQLLIVDLGALHPNSKALAHSSDTAIWALIAIKAALIAPVFV
jgi:hypothetical protein